MSIVTLPEAKQQLSIDPEDTSQDNELQGYVDAITAVVEDFKGEVIEQREIVEEKLLRQASSFMLDSAPVLSLDAVATVDGTTTWDVDNLHVDRRAGEVTVLSGPAVSGLVTVTYTAGYETVPANYRRAALVIIQHNWETRRGVGVIPGGVVGAEETYDPRYSYDIPRKALEWLGSPLPGVA